VYVLRSVSLLIRRSPFLLDQRSRKSPVDVDAIDFIK
jgi:hypothetical protein